MLDAVILSDIHLGCDLRAGQNRAAWSKPRPVDASLASFLDWHAARREEGKPWRLILNGDIVDFVAITATPGPGEPVPFTVTPEERHLGLAQLCDIAVRNKDRPGVGAVDPSDHIEERRLARTGGTHDRDIFPPSDIERDPL